MHDRPPVAVEAQRHHVGADGAHVPRQRVVASDDDLHARTLRSQRGHERDERHVER